MNDIEVLQRQILEMQEKLGGFCLQQRQAANDLRNSAADYVQQATVQVEELKKREKEAVVMTKQLILQENEREEMISKVEGENEKLKAMSNRVAIELITLQNELVSGRHNMTNDKSENDARSDNCNFKKVEISKANRLFAERLGLQISPCANGNIRLVFTNIDQTNPERPFSLELCPGPFEVVHCEPALDNLDELLFELNQTNNIRAFTKEVRRLFKTVA